MFDRDGDGCITASELRQVMYSMGERLSEEEIANMVTEADKNGDGVIDYEGACVRQVSRYHEVTSDHLTWDVCMY